MSNEINRTLMDNMRDNVHELWVIDGRPDLEDDCLHYSIVMIILIDLCH